jgi:hypothetical protein
MISYFSYSSKEIGHHMLFHICWATFDEAWLHQKSRDKSWILAFQMSIPAMISEQS